MINYGLKILLLVLLPGIAGLAMAGDSLLPSIPEAQKRFSEAQGCVEPTDDMRKNHMEYILHQRDATVHEGIRTDICARIHAGVHAGMHADCGGRIGYAAAYSN